MLVGPDSDLMTKRACRKADSRRREAWLPVEATAWEVEELRQTSPTANHRAESAPRTIAVTTMPQQSSTKVIP
jgi:hypothetical protein